MRRTITLWAAIIFVVSVYADRYEYRFDQTPLSEALTRIAEEHKNLQINFIYNELNNYKSTAYINADNAYDALRQAIGLNPVSVVNKGNRFYIEALQHGRFKFSGKVVGSDKEPVAGASLMLLSRTDSAVVTYSITDSDGGFSIPCDRRQVVAKIACIGYKTKYHNFDRFNIGTIVIEAQPITLSGVKVETRASRLATDKNTYIPSMRQKKSSQNAIELLRRMAIPQIVLTPGSNAVEDLFGNTISVYINGHKAEDYDLQGMNMTDVRKVELIEAPSDPRFRGEERVVNFVVQEYEYGGYTKTSAAETILNGFSNDLSVFNKFTARKLTYDLFAGSVNGNHHHTGTDTWAAYMLADGNDNGNIDRSEICTASHKRSDEFPVSLRISYNTDRFTARNTINYTHNSTPRNDMSGRLDIGGHQEDSHEYRRLSPSRYNNFYYHGNFWGSAGKGIILNITPSFNYTRRSNRSEYSSTAAPAINNKITEDAYNWGVQASGSKAIGQNQNLLFDFTSGQTINRLRYSNSNNSFNSFSNLFLGGLARYRFQTSRYSLNAHLRVAYEHTSINGIINKDIYPTVGLRGSLLLDRKNQLNAYLYYQTTTPGIGLRSDDIVQSNELMYITGNPNLHNVRNIVSNISYNFAPDNAFSTAFFTGYEEDFDRVAAIYRLYENGTALLRDFINDGNYLKFYIGASINYKMLDNSLQLYGNVAQNFYRTTGIYKTDLCPIRIQLQATYYWKLFNIQVWWANKEKKLTENSNIIICGRDSYGLSMGWGNGVWNVNFSARNILRRNWESSTWYRNTPLYAERQIYYDPWAHANLNLSITYTVGYGKKIRRGNEIGGGTTAPSAILK